MVRSYMSKEIWGSTKDLMTILPVADILWTGHRNGRDVVCGGHRWPWRGRELTGIEDVLIEDWRSGHWHEIGVVGVKSGRIVIAHYRSGMGVGTYW